jgi:hypothetical protein
MTNVSCAAGGSCFLFDAYTVGSIYTTVPTSVAISTTGFDVIGGTVAV